MSSLSPYDSRRFGFGVHRVFCETPDEADAALSSAIEEGGELLVLRFPAMATVMGAWLLDLGYPWTFADTLVYYQRSIKERLVVPTNPGYKERVGTAEDADRIGQLVEELFAGYPSHYRWNPATNRVGELAEGYAEWARRLVSEQDALSYLVESEDGDLAAVVCTEIVGERGDVLVGGVSRKHGRQGLYRWTIDGTYNCLLERGIAVQQTSTQVHNFAVQKVWARSGLEIFKAVQTVHINLVSGDGEQPA